MKQKGTEPRFCLRAQSPNYFSRNTGRIVPFGKRSIFGDQKKYVSKNDPLTQGSKD